MLYVGASATARRASSSARSACESRAYASDRFDSNVASAVASASASVPAESVGSTAPRMLPSRGSSARAIAAEYNVTASMSRPSRIISLPRSLSSETSTPSSHALSSGATAVLGAPAALGARAAVELLAVSGAESKNHATSSSLANAVAGGDGGGDGAARFENCHNSHVGNVGKGSVIPSRTATADRTALRRLRRTARIANPCSCKERAAVESSATSSIKYDIPHPCACCNPSHASSKSITAG